VLILIYCFVVVEMMETIDERGDKFWSLVAIDVCGFLILREDWSE